MTAPNSILVRRRAIVYIDGFNLYYGSLSKMLHKWLNLEILFGLLRPDDNIVEIKYFTAIVSGPERIRQQDEIVP